MPKFVATFRVAFDSESEVQANVEMEVLAQRMEDNLDEEAGDQVRLSELVEYNTAQTPAELIERLRATRNGLLKLKRKDTFELARAIDMTAFGLEKGITDDMLPQHYDYGSFLETAEKVWAGANPT